MVNSKYWAKLLLLHKTGVQLIKRYNNYDVIYFFFFQNQALELSWGSGSTVFLSWTFGRTSSSQDSRKVELCQQLGEKLGLTDGQQVQSSHSEMCALCFESEYSAMAHLDSGSFPNVVMSVIQSADQIFVLTYWMCAFPLGLFETMSAGFVSTPSVCGTINQ